MSKVQDLPVDGFTRRERDYLRNALNRFFSTLPSVAEGIQLRRWRGGGLAGQPKVPLVAQGLIARGLMQLDAEQRLPRLFFTETGMTALRAMMMDRRFGDPETFAHVRRELGIDPA